MFRGFHKQEITEAYYKKIPEYIKEEVPLKDC